MTRRQAGVLVGSSMDQKEYTRKAGGFRQQNASEMFPGSKTSV